MDLHEDSKKNLVTATFELPGLKKEDVDIQVNNNRLTISGESKLSREKKEEGYIARERRSGKFSRTLQLPQGVEVCAYTSFDKIACTEVTHTHRRIKSMLL